MMLTKIMFRFSILICAVAATTLSIEAQESKPRGLAGTVNGTVNLSPTKEFSIEIPVLPSLGGVISDTRNVVTFQDSFGLQVSVAAFAQDATLKWELSTRGTKDYLIYFLGNYVLPDFRRYCPKTSVESAAYSAELLDGTVFAYILMPGGSMFEAQSVFAQPASPPVAKRGNMMFVKNGYTYVVSTELSERVTEGSSYKKTAEEENQILHTRLLGIVKKMQFLSPASLAAPIHP